MEGNPWKTLSSKEVYRNKWFRIREDKVIRPDGKGGIYGVLEVKPSVSIVAVNDNHEIAFVEQWRYPHNKFSIEIPSGGSDPEDKSVLESAKRELSEEAGIKASKWTFLGSIDQSNGATNDTCHLFLAEDIKVFNQKLGEDESIKLKWIKFDEALRMILDNKITHAGSIVTILKVDKIRNLKQN